MALIGPNVMRGSFWELYSWRAWNSLSKDGLSIDSSVINECAWSVLGTVRGVGSNFWLDDLLTQNPETCEVMCTTSFSNVVTWM